MVTLGVDAHKQVHVALAVDERGRPLGTWQGRNAATAWQELLDWAAQWDDRRWGIEGAGGYGRGLAQHLVAAGEAVYEVNPRLTAASRRRSRKQDKNDRLDAQAVARVVLREGEALPAVVAEDDLAAVLDVLSRERDRAKSQVDRLRNQLHHRLFHVDPQYKTAYPSLSKRAVVAALMHYAPPAATPLLLAQAAAVRRVAALLGLALDQVHELTAQIQELGTTAFPALAELPGAGTLTAGQLAGVLGTRRFTRAAGLAAYGGAAPLETSSAGRVRHRLNRGGNRRLNSILYMMALTQWGHESPGRRYIARRMSEGKSWLEAVRALKWFIARAILRVWQQHYAHRQCPTPAPLT